MIKLFRFNLLLMLLALNPLMGSGQVHSYNPPNAANLGIAQGLLHLAHANEWYISSAKATIAGELIPDSSKIHIYNADFSTKLATIGYPALSNAWPIDMIEYEGHVWICLLKGYRIGGPFISFASPTAELSRINRVTKTIDSTLLLTFNDSLYHISLAVNASGLKVFGAYYSNSFQGHVNWPANFIQIKTINNQGILLADTVISTRNGIYTSGTVRDIFSLSNNEIVVSGIGMASWNVQGDTIRQGFADIALYDQLLTLKYSDVILAENHPNWPLEFSLRLRGPIIGGGMLFDPRSNSYFYLGSHRDTSDVPLGNILLLHGQQQLFYAKMNQFKRITQRFYFGRAGLNDILTGRTNQLALAPNGRLYSVSTVNFNAWVAQPDSIQQIAIHSIDTNFNQPSYTFWHDGSDVSAVSLVTHPNGIHVLANSQGRGGEKFHVLRIEGTAWASSSSQQLWPEWGVFPNPARERVFVSGELPSKIMLHDMQGRLLHHWQNAESNELQLPALPPGIYLLHGSNAQGQRWPVRKLVVR